MQRMLAPLLGQSDPYNAPEKRERAGQPEPPDRLQLLITAKGRGVGPIIGLMEHIGPHLQAIERTSSSIRRSDRARTASPSFPISSCATPTCPSAPRLTTRCSSATRWNNNLCFPGQDRLAKDIGMCDRQRQRLHQGARGLRPHRDHAPRSGQDQPLHHQFRREAQGVESLDFSRLKARFAARTGNQFQPAEFIPI